MCPPFDFRTIEILFGIECSRLEHIFFSSSSWYQMLIMASLIKVFVERLCLLSFRLTIAHRFSTGLRSGEFPGQSIYSWLLKKILLFLWKVARCKVLLKNWTYRRAAVWQPGHQMFSQNVVIFIQIHHAFDRDQSARSWSIKNPQNIFLGRCLVACWIYAFLIGSPILLMYRDR